MRPALVLTACAQAALAFSSAAQPSRRAPYQPTAPLQFPSAVQPRPIQRIQPIVGVPGRAGAPGLVNRDGSHFDAPDFSDRLYDREYRGNEWIEGGGSYRGETKRGSGYGYMRLNSRDRIRTRERDLYDGTGRRFR